MPTIHNLSLEIIEHIFSIAYPVSQAGGGSKRQPRTLFLLAVSLVCRDWTPCAQRVLRAHVYLSHRTIDGFLRASSAQVPVQMLHIIVQGTNSTSVEMLLHKVRGVQDLTLESGSLSVDCLCGSNMKGNPQPLLMSIRISDIVSRSADLKKLYLCDIAEVTSPVYRRSSFDLTAIKLFFNKQPSSFQLMRALSQQSAVTSFHLTTSQFDPATLLRCLAPLAQQLRTLVLNSTYSLSHSVAAGDFLSHCSGLEHLTIDRALIEVVNCCVAVPLVSLMIKGFGAEEVTSLVDVLREPSIAIAKLEVLVIVITREGEISLEELRRRCRERKIELIFQNIYGNRWCVLSHRALSHS